ncbi:MAG: protein-export membrane protein SecF [Gammaproteobacteria bacterium RIFCSPLOWO2_02_FULL_47_50]|nr:MAG: protein-export membrane protein SecF [Gammaproteobacteria bacterium RIFCSPLOWO2_01_FULL_47_190]OGT75293.1 MAG: protein-export membrane protein SecF [Gammaproteobacteria bacterium RIFCSPLOWO2_12_47_11]OGT81635.1 MAG: protein-export membrane protein SecF [Gammaproteobacteria bacterium RIFCSPLOWO2_02_FULL_47_50]OGT87491.1 MAG: protein-export membrane protein SecF [Gammaproteobacteria bacterium RIFCSPLOWO2_12_FULL_47_76]
MKFITKTNFDFMGKRRIACWLSGISSVVLVVLFMVQGLNYGIDFTGGTIVEVGYTQEADLTKVRNILVQSEFSNAVVQYYGAATDVLVRIPPHEGLNSADISNKLIELLGSSQSIEIRRVEFVGPQVGDELREDGGLAMIYALLGILLYVAIRFQTRFAIGAVVATVHDVIITVGFFVVTRMEFDLTVLAAVLAVIGYSLNDTVVVFDRIRENFHKLRKATPVEVMNVSLNETLSRTIMTGLTTLLVLVALFLFGGETLLAFSTALIIGILIGTYSSIYIASPVTLALGVSKQDLMPVVKEGTEADNRP